MEQTKWLIAGALRFAVQLAVLLSVVLGVLMAFVLGGPLLAVAAVLLVVAAAGTLSSGTGCKKHAQK